MGIDKISIERVKTLHPAVRESALSILQKSSVALGGNSVLRFTYTFRSFIEQNGLYQIGRTVSGKKVTNAPAGYSYHNYGLAFDIVLLTVDSKGAVTASYDLKSDRDKDGIPDWQEVVKIAKAEGWEWGGDFRSFKDYPHFQKAFGYTEKQLLLKHQKGDFLLDTNFVKL